MVKVDVVKQAGTITSISVSGHADSGPHGQDLVCAGVSSVLFGLMNAFDLKDQSVNCHVSDNRIDIQCDFPTAVNQLLLEVGLIQLQTIQDSYPKNIQIKTQEVAR